jgi:hypothetical protein
VKFDIPKADTLVVTYDNKKTTAVKIREALRKGGLAPSEDPVNLN